MDEMQLKLPFPSRFFEPELMVVLAPSNEKRAVLVIGSRGLLAVIAHQLVHFPERSEAQIFLVADNNPRKTAEEIILERFKPESLLAPLVDFPRYFPDTESFLELKQRKLQKFQSKKISPHKMRNT